MPVETLRDRSLTPWAKPTVHVSGGRAEDDEATTFVEVPIDTPTSAIAPFVDTTTRELFAKFDGYRLPLAAIEEWCRRLGREPIKWILKSGKF